MKEIIPFKKDIIFKTKIAKITDISLTHDYKVLENVIEGEFLLAGTYKMTEASVVNEEFIYSIPFSIALGDTVNRDSISLVLHDFNYEVKEDIMTIKVDLDMTCEEKQEGIKEMKEEVIERSVEETIDELIESEQEINNKNIEGNLSNMNISIMDNEVGIKQESEEKTKESIMALTNKVRNSKDTVTYKIYIVRENDSIETIAAKYNVALNDLIDYNDIESLSIGDKIVIPYKNE